MTTGPGLFIIPVIILESLCWMSLKQYDKNTIS